jgi:hypothetical protein
MNSATPPRASARPARCAQLMLAAKQLLSERGEMNGMAVASSLVERLDGLDDDELDAFFDHLARELAPTRSRCWPAQAYAAEPRAAS